MAFCEAFSHQTNPPPRLLELIAVLTKHFSPPPSEVIQRFRFYSRVRQPGESVSVSVFVAELRKLTKYCNFGDSLDKALRDRIVGGINHEATRKKLLSERELTYKRAVEIAKELKRPMQIYARLVPPSSLSQSRQSQCTK